LAPAAQSVLEDKSVVVAAGRGETATEAALALRAKLPPDGLSALVVLFLPEKDPH
jgi:hypothetical protein